MSVIVTPTVEIQSDASATDLSNLKVPNGQTIKGYLNNGVDTFFANTGFKIPASTGTFGLYQNNNGNNVDMGWNYDNHEGAGAAFRNANWSGSEGGAFVFWARNSTNTSTLKGYTNGSLKWCEKEIVTEDKLTWNLLYNSYIFPSSTTQSFTPTVSFSDVHEVLVSLVYSTASYRQSFVFTADIIKRSGMVCSDFYFAGSRLYCTVLLNTSTGKIEVGGAGSSGGSTSWGSGSGKASIALFYR